MLRLVRVIVLLYVLVCDTVETGETLVPSDWDNEVTIRIVKYNSSNFSEH